MGVFKDVSQFLETRLEEFLRNNPHLELQALDEQLREQEDDSLRLILDLQKKDKAIKEQILSTAQDIQRWHVRIENAQAANRLDLVKAAQEREAALLRQGNQLWGQMQGVKSRLDKAKELYKQVHKRRQEVKKKVAEAAAKSTGQKPEQNWETTSWNQSSNSYKFSSYGDPLEDEFKRWEAQQELERMKRDMGR